MFSIVLNFILTPKIYKEGGEIDSTFIFKVIIYEKRLCMENNITVGNFTCIPESLNTDFWLHNNLREFTALDFNSKGDFVLKNIFQMFVIRFLVYKNKSESKIYIVFPALNDLII